MKVSKEVAERDFEKAGGAQDVGVVDFEGVLGKAGRELEHGFFEVAGSVEDVAGFDAVSDHGALDAFKDGVVFVKDDGQGFVGFGGRRVHGKVDVRHNGSFCLKFVI